VILATIEEVSRVAGVSIATVSRVLNNSAPVTNDKRKRVLKALRELNYQAASMVRAPTTGASDTVAVVVEDLASPFIGMMLRGINDVVSELGMHVAVTSGNRRAEDERHAIEFVRRSNCAALILDIDQLSEEELLALASNDTSVVVVSRYIPELAERCVYVDNEAGGKLATEYLLEQGHERIAHIAGPHNQERGRDRTFGYRRALDQAGLLYREEFVVAAPDYSEESGERAAERLLDRALDFTAIFAANDQMAAGTLTALRQRGVSVPGDISLVGYDDLPFARHLYPALTTVRQPVVELGRAAAKLATSHLDGKAEEVIHRFEPTLIVRDSVRPYAP
jgi:LacI family transcriptional regulator